MKFLPEQFTATQFNTAEQKAKFANHFARFVESGFKETMFPKWFYTRLSTTFGHIAHYNQRGFYDTFFTSHDGRMAFIEHTLEGGGYGDAAYTDCDVERALKTWLIESGIPAKVERERNAAYEAAERAQLAKLKEKYEPGI